MIDKLQETLAKLYGVQTEQIAKKLSHHIDTIKVKPGTADKEWYRNIELYCVYPDSVLYDATKSPLQNLYLHLEKIHALGVNAIHILPFLESPLLDRGFDISNYLKVNPKYGTLKDLKMIMEKAHEYGLHVFMDLVFNHVSDQHEWFKKAVAGDEYYRDFFLHTHEKPKFIRKFHKDSAVWAEYEVEGKTETVNIAFPEYAGPIPHWQEQKDGYWYYHTYYPSQIDLNWRNPDLFIEMAKIVLYWAKFGFNFRLDAIPFVGKGPYKQVNIINSEAQMITAAFKYLADAVNPNSVLLVETYEELDSVIEYFGKPDQVSAHLSYNFHLCTTLWVSLVTEKAKPLREKLDKLKLIPSHAEWLNFIRNHDELSLAYLDSSILKTMQKNLLKNGADFREGYGISGRTFSLLGQNLQHFTMAYFMLASMPGGIMIPYGDEIAKTNIPLEDIPESDRQDTRNINRGIIQSDDYALAENIKIFEIMHNLLSQRRIFRLYLNNWPQPLNTPEHIFALAYKNGPGGLYIYINLSQKSCEFLLEKQSWQIVMQVNEIQLEDNLLKLGPYAGVWLKSNMPEIVD